MNKMLSKFLAALITALSVAIITYLSHVVAWTQKIRALGLEASDVYHSSTYYPEIIQGSVIGAIFAFILVIILPIPKYATKHRLFINYMLAVATSLVLAAVLISFDFYSRTAGH